MQAPAYGTHAHARFTEPAVSFVLAPRKSSTLQNFIAKSAVINLKRGQLMNQCVNSCKKRNPIVLAVNLAIFFEGFLFLTACFSHITVLIEPLLSIDIDETKQPLAMTRFHITYKSPKIEKEQGQDMGVQHEYNIKKNIRMRGSSLIYQFADQIRRACPQHYVPRFIILQFSFHPANYKQYKSSLKKHCLPLLYTFKDGQSAGTSNSPFQLRSIVSNFLIFKVKVQQQDQNPPFCISASEETHIPQPLLFCPPASCNEIPYQNPGLGKGAAVSLCGGLGGDCLKVPAFRGCWLLRNSIIYRYQEQMQPKKSLKNNSDVFRSSFTFSESKHTSNNTTCAQSFVYDQPPPAQIPLTTPQFGSLTPKPTPQTQVLCEHSPSRPYYRKSEYVERRSEVVKSENLFSKYQAIQQILYSQNLNLKQQNVLLLAEVHRLRDSTRKYRTLDQTHRLELQRTREEAQAYRTKAEQLQLILSTKLAALEKMVLGQHNSEVNQSLEDLLNYSDQFSK